MLLLHLFFHLSRTSGRCRPGEVSQSLKSHVLYVRGWSTLNSALEMDDLIEVMG